MDSNVRIKPMRIRSGFKSNQKKHRSNTILAKKLYKKSRKMLSSDILRFSFLSKLKKTAKSPQKNAKSYLRRDIHQKNYRNPYQKQKAVNKKALFNLFQKNRFQINLVVLCFVLIIWIGVLFIQPTFYLDSVTFTGLDEIPEDQAQLIVQEEMNKRSKAFIKRSHLFFLSEERIEDAIKEKYGIESIQFKTHWPSNSLMIDLKEKVSVLAYSIKDDYYTIDREGVVVKQIDQEILAQKGNIPLIFQYNDQQEVHIGSPVMTKEQIQLILNLYTQLQSFHDISIHSFRLHPVNKRSVVIPEKRPDVPVDETVESSEELQYELDQLAESIANAQSVEDKIQQIKSTLNEIDIQQLEEGDIERYLEQEKVYEPNESFAFQELEVYTVSGWNLKLGSRIFSEPDLLETYLNVFATLSSQIDINGEVKDYIDLRFPNRVYYK